ncbi:MAG: ABC transporter ATP-binding protein [Verrucomicrobia bacterium]|nr:MAG: ABC transporter ATP-binding protein [Verrucomicrobiota bacterium]
MSLLRARDLSKRFGELKAVDGVSLTVESGEIYGLLGPNGAGKTTTLSMICGLLAPDSGEVRIDGKSFHEHPGEVRRAMGVVPQEIALYKEMSGRENLEFWGRIAGISRRDARTRAAELLDALGLADRADDPVKNYSGGMQRRINLGCALMHRPRLLLLDEPTVGIDPQARANILDFIRGLVADGMGVLYTTHYLEEAETLCHRIGIIDHGRLLAEGTLEELKRHGGETDLFAVEGDFNGADPAAWDGFAEAFRIIQQTERSLTVAPLGDPDPARCLKALLNLPVRVENVTVKRPSLNETFLRLTGRELRE